MTGNRVKEIKRKSNAGTRGGRRPGACAGRKPGAKNKRSAASLPRPRPEPLCPATSRAVRWRYCRRSTATHTIKLEREYRGSRPRLAHEMPKAAGPRQVSRSSKDVAGGRLKEAYSRRINVKNVRVAVLRASD
jgi:hypothetical protein